MSNILVTGGNGFLGSYLVDALTASSDHQVVVLARRPHVLGDQPEGVTFIQGSLADAGLVQRTLRDYRIEIAYHAAWSSIHETSVRDVPLDLEANLLMTVRLLEACRRNGVKRFVFFSSGGTVYGLPQITPTDESHPTNPISAYGVAKLAAESYIRMYHHLYGLEFVILRPSVPYGPRQNPLRRQGAVSVFTHRALRGLPITIWGDGSSIRDYFYAGDMVAPLLAAMETPFEGRTTFNLGGDRGYSLVELIGAIENAINVKAEVDFREARNFDVPNVELDSSAATKTLGWRPETALEDGIQRTARWLDEWMSSGRDRD